ncbi:MAG: formyl transferase [Candidatus Yanofskybacteria bacterium CG10_big_fil_rev_8_21_14_0_10_36_16]|uniref:Formyl transferase n=1 Tax=Candidatus Yanofskybacteria bacterium CG10_big_fil_rev_8_21_14_0_10_36_16 TaxID=1975096 RepID=A0A2J0QB81_9BACT|nr:MAG: formyl transferase [Candidatus Yanofskybacteria bacterium CG10_big_fil_rev_8_21_14_0_10_36_16]
MIKKVILMGRKPGASMALKWLLNNGIEVPFVVADPNEAFKIKLKDTALALGIPIVTEGYIYDLIRQKDTSINNVDLVISYLYWKRIRDPLINLPQVGCINFHPAPLPDYKGRAGYNTAILDKREDYGVSAHFIDSEEFDAGPIIKVKKFPISPVTENALSLEEKSQDYLLELFKEVIQLFIEGDEVITTSNLGGVYWSKKDLERNKEINLNEDSAEEMDRKIRAFFFPPYCGAKLIIGDQEVTLINKKILKYLSNRLNR